MVLFQSTRPLRGETDTRQVRAFVHVFSIHSPLAGRDSAPKDNDYVTRQFSIHSPLAGRDGKALAGNRAPELFNPLAPCGARLPQNYERNGTEIFQSTRPLRGETCSRGPIIRRARFQSTRPLRGETAPQNADCARLVFSIHSPLAGRDMFVSFIAYAYKVFNPLAPCGARHLGRHAVDGQACFQSTRPLRGETKFTV